MNELVNELPRPELTACSQVWPSQVLLLAICFNILDKLLILPCLEIFHEDFWIHVGKKKISLQDLATLVTSPHPTPLGLRSAGAGHGGLLQIRHVGSPLPPLSYTSLSPSPQPSSRTGAVYI